MNVKELVQQVRAQHPNIASLPEPACEELVREVFKNIRRTLVDAPEGMLEIPGLGRFSVTIGQKDKDGETVTVRRVVYRAPQVKRPDTRREGSDVA